ncbi:MAG: hypothetical protein U5N55_04865 [Cypionkella sp.]|nr:hypothetical protein [Cypionkella sp.]
MADGATMIEDPKIEDQVDDVETGEADVPPIGDGGEEGAGEDDAELRITLEGEETAADDDEDESELDERGRSLVARIRDKMKEERRLRKEAEAKIEAQVQAAPARAALKMPTLEEHGYRDADYAAAMKAYVKAEAEQEAQAEQEAKMKEAAATEYKAKFDGYSAAKTELRVRDFDASEDAVRKAFSPTQQAIILRVMEPDEAAKVVYALGKSPKAMAELSVIDGMRDPDKFTAMLLRKAMSMKVEKKAPPPPESRVKGGSGAAMGGSLAGRLAAAEARAEKTRDRTEVIQIKAEMRRANGG